MTSRLIGDPTLLGWSTFVLYGVACWACLKARSHATGAHASFPGDRAAWLGLVVATALLGLNKQLDLQTRLIRVARPLVRTAAMNGHRRLLQVGFLALLLLILVALGLWLVSLLSETSQAAKRATIGLCLVGTYVLIRAVQILTFTGRLGPRRLAPLELIGLLIIVFAAHSTRRTRL